MPDSGERDREDQELQRQSQEHDREENEHQSDTSRVRGEEKRVAGEEYRVTGETDRDAAEGGRVTDETGRTGAEDGRVTAEDGRVTAAENQAIAAESQAIAEEARVEEARQPIWVPRTQKSTLYALLGCLLVGSIPGGMSAWIFAERGLISAERQRSEFCSRVKADRIDNARAWTQGEITWKVRARDPKLSADERRLAATTALVYAESAESLRMRLYDCRALIDDNREVIDPDALREAKGDL